MKGPDHLLIDRRALEAEPLQVLHHGQPRSRHPIADGGCIPVGRLGAEQIGQYLHGGALALEAGGHGLVERRSEEHTSELQSLMRISYAVFCLKKKKQNKQNNTIKTNRIDKHTQSMPT